MAMQHFDRELSEIWPDEFTTEEDWVEWAINLVADYLIDSLGYSATDVYPERDSLLATDFPIIEDESDAHDLVDLLLNCEYISSQEALYSHRLVSVLATDGWSESQRIDSLESCRTDILAVSWESSEEAIIPFMSIAYHSAEFWQVGLVYTDPSPHTLDLDWDTIALLDLCGGFIGYYLTRTFYDGIAGAALSSVAAVIIDIVSS